MKRIFRLWFFCFLVFNNWGFAQNNDAQLWTSIGMEKKLTKSVTLNLMEEFRWCENMTELGQVFSDLGASYKISKSWRFSANYRFTNKKELNNTYSNRHRYYFDLLFHQKYGWLGINLRSRFQSQKENENLYENKTNPEFYSRIKAALKLDFDLKLKPYISTELFYQLNNPEGNTIDNMRYTAGVEYALNKKMSLDFFYLLQQEYNVNKPEKDFVIGLSYNLVIF